MPFETMPNKDIMDEFKLEVNSIGTHDSIAFKKNIGMG